MSNAARHVLLPAVAPLAIVALCFTPVTLISCATRELLALAILGVSAAVAFVTVAIAIRAGARHDASSRWWILSTLIPTLPLVLVLGPLG